MKMKTTWPIAMSRILIVEGTFKSNYVNFVVNTSPPPKLLACCMTERSLCCSFLCVVLMLGINKWVVKQKQKKISQSIELRQNICVYLFRKYLCVVLVFFFFFWQNFCYSLPKWQWQLRQCYFDRFDI